MSIFVVELVWTGQGFLDLRFKHWVGWGTGEAQCGSEFSSLPNGLTEREKERDAPPCSIPWLCVCWSSTCPSLSSTGCTSWLRLSRGGNGRMDTRRKKVLHAVCHFTFLFFWFLKGDRDTGVAGVPGSPHITEMLMLFILLVYSGACMRAINPNLLMEFFIFWFD